MADAGNLPAAASSRLTTGRCGAAIFRAGAAIGEIPRPATSCGNENLEAFGDLTQGRRSMSTTEYYTEERHGPHEIFDLGDFALESGITLPAAKLAYKTHGTLNKAKDNVILFPHMWSGTSKAMEIFIGEDRPLDPSKYFIILPGQFANGFSSSPSNTPPPFNGGAFPHVTIGDDVRAQHRLRHRAFRHRAPGAGPRLVDGRRADLRVGGALSRHGQAGAAVRRHRQDHPARLHLRARRTRTRSSPIRPGTAASTSIRATCTSACGAMPRSGR